MGQSHRFQGTLLNWIGKPCFYLPSSAIAGESTAHADTPIALNSLVVCRGESNGSNLRGGSDEPRPHEKNNAFEL